MDEEILLERIIVCSIRDQYRSVGICEAEAVSLSSDEVNRKLVLDKFVDAVEWFGQLP